MADGPSGLRIVDVSDSASPQEVGAFVLEECEGPLECPQASLVSLTGTRAYVALERCSSAFYCRTPPGMRSIDVSDPANPNELARFDSGYEGNPVGIVATDDRVFVSRVRLWSYAGIAPCALARGGLQVLDAALQHVSKYAPPGGAAALTATETHVFLVDPGYSQMHTFDVTDPAKPKQAVSPLNSRVLGSSYGMGTLKDVDLADQLYLTRGPDHGRWIADTTSAGPVNRLAMPLNGCSPPPSNEWFMRVCVQGGYAYVIDEGSTLRVFASGTLNWRDPVGVLQGVTAREMDLAGNLVFLVDAAGDLHVVDISDPAQLLRLSGLPGPAVRAFAVGSLLYVAAGDAGLRIVDVSDPAAPVEVGTLDTPGRAIDVFVLDRRAYVADGQGGLRIVDVAHPREPVDLGAFTGVRNVRRVYAAGSLVHILADGGLYILRAEPPMPPVGLIYLPLLEAGSGILDMPELAAQVGGATGAVRIWGDADRNAHRAMTTR